MTITAYALLPAPNVMVDHWSQWLQGWCVDWDHHGGALRAETSVWRANGRQLVLASTHTYERPGRYTVLVKAFDALGGSATRALRVRVPP